MAVSEFGALLFVCLPIGGYYVGKAIFNRICGVRYIDVLDSTGVGLSFDPGTKKTLGEDEGRRDLPVVTSVNADNVELTGYIQEGDGIVRIEGMDKSTGKAVFMRGKADKRGRIVPVEGCVWCNLEDMAQGEGGTQGGKGNRLVGQAALQRRAEAQVRQELKAQVRQGACIPGGKAVVGYMPNFARRWIRRSEWNVAEGHLKGAKIKMALFRRR